MYASVEKKIKDRDTVVFFPSAEFNDFPAAQIMVLLYWSQKAYSFSLAVQGGQTTGSTRSAEEQQSWNLRGAQGHAQGHFNGADGSLLSTILSHNSHINRLLITIENTLLMQI